MPAAFVLRHGTNLLKNLLVSLVKTGSNRFFSYNSLYFVFGCNAVYRHCSALFYNSSAADSMGGNTLMQSEQILCNIVILKDYQKIIDRNSGVDKNLIL